ncbi:cysteine hydrolase family protein [Brachybacterium sp. DNPG3]
MHASTPAPASRPWLVVVDPQRIFADPGSDWCSPFFADALPVIQGLAGAVGPERTLLTRWLPTADRRTAWGDYFRAWPFADVPADDPLYALVDGVAGLSAHPSVDEPTFGKWGPQLAARVGAPFGADDGAARTADDGTSRIADDGADDAAAPRAVPHLLVTGVSTDCCVITTVLAAADAGLRVTVVTDAVAHSTAADGAAALQVMGLFPPQVDLRTSTEVLAALDVPSDASSDAGAQPAADGASSAGADADADAADGPREH